MNLFAPDTFGELLAQKPALPSPSTPCYSEPMIEEWIFHSYEVNFQGRVRPDALLARMSDLAKRHADQLGFGFHDMKARGYFWVVRRIQVLIDRIPLLDESLTVETMPSAMKGMRGRRQIIISAGKETVLHCDMEWALLSWESRLPAPVSRVFDQLPETTSLFDAAAVMPSKHSFPALLPSGASTLGETRQARFADIDLHHHVNNARYITWSHDFVPQQVWERAYPRYLDITFKKETVWGDEVELHEMREGEWRCVEGCRAEGVPVFTLKERWEPDK